MSLTKEEKELIASYYPNGLVPIIDRLVEENEELEEERDLAIEEAQRAIPAWMHEKVVQGNKELQANLSSLLEAAERRIYKGHNDTCGFILVGGDESNFCSCGHYNLNKAVKEAKGEHGRAGR